MSLASGKPQRPGVITLGRDLSFDFNILPTRTEVLTVFILLTDTQICLESRQSAIGRRGGVVCEFLARFEVGIEILHSRVGHHREGYVQSFKKLRRVAVVDKDGDTVVVGLAIARVYVSVDSSTLVKTFLSDARRVLRVSKYRGLTSCDCFSITTTSCPRSVSRTAAWAPDAPPPMTMTSVLTTLTLPPFFWRAHAVPARNKIGFKKIIVRAK